MGYGVVVGREMLVAWGWSETGRSVGTVAESGRLVSVGVGVLITRCSATAHRFGRSSCWPHATKTIHARKPRNNTKDVEFRVGVES